MPPKRMTANPVKAPRYRPGKAIAESESESYSEASEDEASLNSAQPIAPPPKVTTAGKIRSNLSKIDINERQKIAVAKEAVRIEEERKRREREEEGFVTDESEEDEDGSADESSEEESSEEEAPRRILIRPTFIKKNKRDNVVAKQIDSNTHAEQIAVKEARKNAAINEIVEEQIRKELAAKAAGKKNWDDDEEEGDVDDTDDIDPEAEYAAWKLRELQRMKREREAIEEREKEREEIERRKDLTEEERKREDDEYILKQKDDRDAKGKMSYMQKYYHKGAFYQDDAKAQGLDRREIMGSKFADDVDRELLPQALQIRDLTKVGRKGATKYRDLKSEDTGQWGQFEDRRRKDGPRMFSVDERFMSHQDRDSGLSGANSTPVVERKVLGVPEGPRSMREGSGLRDDIDIHRPSRDRRSRSRSTSRCRDGEGDAGNRHKRSSSSSRDMDRYRNEKRRRVDSQ